jgi:heme/copper-type cytochrome/quinol oxidase subunit 4
MKTFLVGLVIAIALAAANVWMMMRNNEGVAAATDTPYVHVADG